MTLGEKEYLRIFAYQQIMKNDDSYKMCLVLDRTMDYKKVLSQPSRIHRRISNLVFSENPDRNLIFFRPLDIAQGDHMELIFIIREYMAPFWVEIGKCGEANDFPRNVIVINYTQTVIRFDGNADNEYEVSVERKGKELDPLFEKEYLEGVQSEKLQSYLEELTEKYRNARQESWEKLQYLQNEEKELKIQVANLGQKVRKLHNKELEDEKRIEANATDILEKQKLSDKIASWLPAKKRVLQDILKDLEMTPRERQRKKESYQKHIEFLMNIEKYYKEQKKDDKFAEILQSIREEAEELETYFLKLDEIEQNRSTEDGEHAAAANGIQEDVL